MFIRTVIFDMELVGTRLLKVRICVCSALSLSPNSLSTSHVLSVQSVTEKVHKTGLISVGLSTLPLVSLSMYSVRAHDDPTPYFIRVLPETLTFCFFFSFPHSHEAFFRCVHFSNSTEINRFCSEVLYTHLQTVRETFAKPTHFK